MATYDKKKPIGKTIIAGIVVIGLYALLLTHQDFVIANFSKGGLYAFLPIATAFVFSIVHGSFSGGFWTIVGIEAAKKKQEVK